MTEPEQSTSQAAWNEFADRLKSIGEKITGPTGARTPRERAEGYRYLLGLVATGHQLELQYDRNHPTLERMMTPTRKYIGDGTDTLYYEAKLDGELEYRFTVRRGEGLFFSATVYARDEKDAFYIVDTLIDEDTEFEEVAGEHVANIHLSAERPPGVRNWIQLTGTRPILCTREYFPEFVHAVDAGRYRSASFEIECLSDVPPRPVLSEDLLADGLRRVADFVEDSTDLPIGLSIFAGLNLIEYEKTQEGKKVDATHITGGSLDVDIKREDEHTPQELAAMIDPKLIANNLPGPGIQYVGAWFKLRDDEAIVIEGRDVPCRYWSCQILTRYLESGDYRDHRVGINNRQVKLRDDGRFRIYACHENPGVDNWVCTQGYANGHIVIRTLLADSAMDAEFSVVKTSTIHAD